MKSLFKEPATSLGLLFLRLALGGFVMTHGLAKLSNFEVVSQKFMTFLGMSAKLSLGLVVFAEVLCAILLIIGLFTRMATIPLIITMAVAAFMVHGADPFSAKELALLYLVGYLSLALTGPGRFSMDGLRNKS